MSMPQKLCSAQMALTTYAMFVKHTWLHLQSPELLINGSWHHSPQPGH